MATRKDKIINEIYGKKDKYIKTDIEKLHSREYEYKKFSAIFDFKNEYANSSRDIKMFGIDELTLGLKKNHLLIENEKSTAATSLQQENIKTKMNHVRKLVNVGFDADAIYECPINDLLCNEELPPSNEWNQILEDPFQDSDHSSDADYVPEDDGSATSNEDRDIRDTYILSNILQIEPESQIRVQTFQHCEFLGCTSTVFACCEKCYCFLCMKHYESQTPFSACKNHQFFKESEKSTKRKKSVPAKKLNSYKDKENDKNLINKENKNEAAKICYCEYADCKEEVFSACGKCHCYLCFMHFDNDYTYNDCQKHNSSASGIETSYVSLLTKKGSIRKRRAFKESAKERRVKKAKYFIEKLSLKDPCPATCIKKCTEKITEIQRKQINEEYVSLNWEARGLYMKNLVEAKSVATRKMFTKSNVPKRNVSYSYFFYLGTSKFEVCKTFFLSTLGYNPKNDRRLQSALQKPANKQKDQRGQHERLSRIDTDTIKNDIKSYNPAISHYRREHAPFRLYLPSDVTIAAMYEHFCEKFPNVKLSYETYRRVVRKDMNISFAHLGNEECEVCAHHNQHKKNRDDEIDTCSLCVKYKVHQPKFEHARKAYRKDKKSSVDKNTAYYSVDLQKVIMLPRMEQFKSVIFCPRIIAYNQSFVPLGKSKNNSIPFAAIWNESTSGRNQEDIISAFRAFFIQKRDTDHIVLWMDNCSSQNKNWTIFSFLIYIINSILISAQTITFKYFEPGHTFMSADSFHHRVEQSLQKQGKTYDFNDFVNAVKKAQTPADVKTMEVSDFFSFSDLSSQHKVKKLVPRIYLRDIMVIVAKRGSFVLEFKTNHNDEEYQKLDFLQIKYMRGQNLPEAKQKQVPRGIRSTTKSAIIEKLLNLMPDNRKEFWLNLPVLNEDDKETESNLE